MGVGSRSQYVDNPFAEEHAFADNWYLEWLITATTHPIDQAEDAFLTDALDHIERQAAWARSPHEMAKVVFACCVDSYDRPTKPKLHETDHSIRQILSESIKNIVRSSEKASILL